VEDAAEAAFVDQLLGHGDGGHAAVVVPHHVGHAGLFDGIDDSFRFGGVAAERLFAHHHFAGLGGGDGDVVMRVVGAGDIDEIDFGILDDAAPVGGDVGIAPLGGEGAGAFGVPGADGVEHRFEGNVEEVRDFAERVGVGASHEPVADEADIEFLHMR